MASKDFRSPAHPEPPRQRLTSPWTLLGIAVAVGVTLALIFPGGFGLLSQQRVAKQRPEDVSITYLGNLAKKEPGNPEVRFTLAQQQTQAGKIKEARAALEPLYNHPDPAVRQRARLQDFKLQMQEMTALQPGSPEREQATERLRQELAAMSQYDWPSTGLLELANLANQVGARKLRSELYLRMAKGSEKLEPKWIDEAGSAALADGEYRTAADIYFTQMDRAQSRAERKRLFMRGVAALQAGNMPHEALLAAEQHVDGLIADDEMLRFMIRLAQASNDTQRAQRYAKRLMHMSEASLWRQWLVAAMDTVIAPASAAEPVPPPPTKSPAEVMRGMRPYNAEDYALAYEVFLGNRNLDDAYRVAAAAVQQVPNDMAWRERLAQIAEWSNRSPEALQQWLYIARRTGRGEAWQAVLRLAPGLFNDEALLEAMRYQAAKARLSDDQWRAVVEAYERVGRPREAVTLLENEYQREPRPIFIELQATLLERMGDLDGAIAAYRDLIRKTGATDQRVLTLATLLIVRGDYKEAHQLLVSYQDRVRPEEDEYWRLLADLSMQLQENAAAERALDVLVKSTKAQPDDFNRLIALLTPTQPEAAGRLAEAGYDRFKTTDYLVAALGIYSQRRDWMSMRRVFAKIPPEVEAGLAKSPDYLMLRAEYRMATGHPELARGDYREALRIDPTHRLARIAFMWFLIDRRELPELRKQLALALEQGKDDPQFDGVIGAAFLTLGDSQRAVGYFAKVLKRNPDDYLWLLNYADALEQNNQPDVAWRVRRHAWIKVRQEMGKFQKDKVPLDVLQAQARLALQFTPGDPSLAVIQNLLRQDTSLDTPTSDPHRRLLDAGTRDIALSWAISTEQWVQAKAWLMKQYARDMLKPAWAEAIIAIAGNDVDKLQKMLETEPDAIPRYDRHDAAMKTQQYRLAEDIAFNELSRRPHDDEMHLRLTESVLQHYNSWEVGFTHFTRGALRGNEWSGETGVWLSPRLRLTFEVSDVDQWIHSPGVFASIPGHDTAYGVTALFRHSIGETRLTIFHRDALADMTGFRLIYGRPLGPRMVGRLGLAYNDRTLDTSALAVGGVRDQVFFDLEYNFAKREYLLGELQASRYYTQGERTFIGSGHSLSWELGHRIRTEYPDWNVRLAGSFNGFNHSGSGDVTTSVLVPGGGIPTAAFFLPPSFNVYGIYTGFGTFYRTNYTRAIRPFFDIGVSHNSVTGQGYGAILGASGSVIGGDRLTVYASTGRGGNGVNEVSREVGLRYQYMFDRF
jgi:tetratricopeptide (TPR) repeat protein